MKKLILVLISILVIMNIAYGAITEITEIGPATRITPQEAQFRVQTLKYDPFPVNPGDYFDVWIQVENIGVKDAPNARFELVTKYPFSSTGQLVGDYGRIVGISGKDAGNNQVVLKYRVKVADDAPEGSSELEFKALPDSSMDVGIIKKLPIDIGKTKTDFDVVMQDSTAQGTSIAIANIGDNPATAVTVRINPQDGLKVKGSDASIIGNLDKGDFSTVTFQIMPDQNYNGVLVQISYTDIAGIRNILEKKIIADIAAPSALTAGMGARAGSNTGSYLTNLSYVAAGIVLAVIVMYIRKKSKKTKI